MRGIWQKRLVAVVSSFGNFLIFGAAFGVIVAMRKAISLFLVLAVACLPVLLAQTFPLTVRVTIARPLGGGKPIMDKSFIIQSWADLDAIFADNKLSLDAEELADLHLTGDKTKMSIVHTNPDGVDEYVVTVRQMLGDAVPTEVPAGYFKIRVLVTLPAKEGKVLIDKIMVTNSWAEVDKIFIDNYIPLSKEEKEKLHLDGDKTKMTIIHANSMGIDEYAVTIQKINNDEKLWTPVSTTTTTIIKTENNK